MRSFLALVSATGKFHLAIWLQQYIGISDWTVPERALHKNRIKIGIIRAKAYQHPGEIIMTIHDGRFF